MTEYRSAREDDTDGYTVEFAVGEMQPVAGFAVLRCLSEGGEPITAYSVYGKVGAEELIGILTATLDQLRHEFVDRDEPQLLELLAGEDEEE